MEQYNIEYIERLRIHELRDYARKMGIPSPTTMRKDQLLEKIHAIIEANEINDNNEKNNSHEPLDFFSLLTSPDSAILDNLVSQSVKTAKKKDIKVNEDGELSKTLVMKKSTIMNQNTPYAYTSNDFIGLNFYISQNEAPYSDDIPVEVEGVVDIHPNGYGIIRKSGFVPSNDDIYLTLALVKKYSLQKGDYVKGKVKNILENKPKIMYDISSIDNNSNLSFDDIPYKQLGDSYYLDKFDFDIKKGERIYFNHMSMADAVKLGYDFVDENGVNVKLVNLNARPEEFYESHQKMQVINCPFNKSEADLISTIELVLERIKREFENGKPNILMIYNFSEMVRAFNVDSEGYYIFDKFNLKGINRVKNILFSAKYFDEKSHLSIICVDRDEIPKDLQSVMHSGIMSLFNKSFNCIDNNDDNK